MSDDHFVRVDTKTGTRLVAVITGSGITVMISTPGMVMHHVMSDADAEAIAMWLAARKGATAEAPPASRPLEVEDVRDGRKRLKKRNGQIIERAHCHTTGKVIYESRQDADSAMRFFSGGVVRRRHGQGKTRRAMAIYTCTFCKGLHIGTPKGAGPR